MLLKTTIENLLYDNDVLQKDFQDCKKVIEFLVGKHKEMNVSSSYYQLN
jgi:hypothetical protein